MRDYGCALYENACVVIATVSFTMRCFVALVCLCAVVAAVPWQDCEVRPLAPPVIICPPDEVPEPAKPSSVQVDGLLTSVIKALQTNGAIVVQLIDDLILKNNQELLAFLRLDGGPDITSESQLHFFDQQSKEFWQTIIYAIADLSWHLDRKLTDAYAIIEREFSLVIAQPTVREWLRELRDLSRIGKNLALEAIHTRRDEWNQLSVAYSKQIEIFCDSKLCLPADVMSERFYRIIGIARSELSDVVNNLKLDHRAIAQRIIQRGIELAGKIYQVQVQALKYYVT